MSSGLCSVLVALKPLGVRVAVAATGDVRSLCEWSRGRELTRETLAKSGFDGTLYEPSTPGPSTVNVNEAVWSEIWVLILLSEWKDISEVDLNLDVVIKPLLLTAGVRSLLFRVCNKTEDGCSVGVMNSLLEFSETALERTLEAELVFVELCRFFILGVKFVF